MTRKKTRIDIKSELEILKLYDGVFQIGNVSFPNDYIFSFSQILKLGKNFVPSIILNKTNYFLHLCNTIDEQCLIFNKYVFFEKIKNNQEVKNASSKISNNIRTNTHRDDLNFEFSKIIKKESKNIPIQSETKVFRDLLFENILLENKSDFSSNLSKKQIEDLLFFVKFKPFLVLENDKNLGFSIISNIDYKNLCFLHLNDINSYLRIENNPLSESIDRINKCLLEALKSNYFCQKYYNFLLVGIEAKLGKFRILPKLHKDKFSTRPIINSKNHITEKLCILVDLIIKPIVSNIKHILKDSQQLLQQLDKVFIKKEPFIYSADFESLYTSMIPDHTCTIVCDFLKDKLDENYISIQGFHLVLKLIFENNYFTFLDNYFKQIRGIAMGCKCGPSLANLFLYILEKNWLSLNSVIIYARFIDDLLIISEIELDLNEFLKNFVYLKLNILMNKEVIFLDLNVAYDCFLRKIKFKLYIKPTNNGTYLLPYSNHPSHIFSNIPYALFTRIKRICSNFIDYLYFSFKLSFNLINRDYCPNFIFSVSNKVHNLERNSLLPYKNKEDNKLTKVIKTSFTYEKNFQFFEGYIFESFKSLNLQYNWLDIYKPFIFYNVKQNLSLITIHNPSKSFIKNNCFTFKCNLVNCKICNYINVSSFLDLNGLILPFVSNGNCQSTNLVYIISCIRCKVYYIGETSKSLNQRISQHLYAIKKFRPYLDDNEVANHFCKKGHNLRFDFKVNIFKLNLQDNNLRKATEADLMHIFIRNFKTCILNKKIPKFLNSNNLSFI